MLRPGSLLALSLTGTFVDSLLHTAFTLRKNPSYTGAWPLPQPGFHRLDDACLAGHAVIKNTAAQNLCCRIHGVEYYLTPI